jgi:rhodanese-related sulfurtransferase
MNKYGKIAWLLLVFILTLPLCYGCSTAEPETTPPVFEDITAEAADELIRENEANPDFMIIDVRTPEEYAEGHIADSALIDFYTEDFEEQIGQLDREGKYLVYCRSGNRSSRALSVMEELGFEEVYNMLGGIGAWTAAGLPTVK